jgi:hypothetical protein
MDRQEFLKQELYEEKVDDPTGLSFNAFCLDLEDGYDISGAAANPVPTGLAFTLPSVCN